MSELNNYPVWAFFLAFGVSIFAVFLFRKAEIKARLPFPLAILPSLKTKNKLWTIFPAVFSFLLLTAALFAFVLSILPTKGGWEATTQKKESLDIVIAVDGSLSMTSEVDGVEKTKWSKIIVSEIVNIFEQKKLKDRVGLVVFGDKPFGIWPLTFDYQPIKKLADSRRYPFLPKELGGTYFARAILRILEYLDKYGGDTVQVIVFITDGLDTISPDDQLRIIKKWKGSRGAKKILVPIYLEEESETMTVLCRQISCFIPEVGEQMQKGKIVQLTKGVYEYLSSLPRREIEVRSDSLSRLKQKEARFNLVKMGVLFYTLWAVWALSFRQISLLTRKERTNGKKNEYMLDPFGY